MEKNNTFLSKTKIEMKEIFQSYLINNSNSFNQYLREIWKDLSIRNHKAIKGISKTTFASYYNLPGIISTRLFEFMDANNSSVLEMNQFIQAIETLFSDDHEKVTKLIFSLYDFDKDGLISQEDIRTVLSYISLCDSGYNYLDRVHSQEELFELLNQCFGVFNKGEINYHEFIDLIENYNSEIYFYLLLFIISKRPFTKETLSVYEKQINSSNNEISINRSYSNDNTVKQYVASPRVSWNFLPTMDYYNSNDQSFRRRKGRDYSLNDKSTILTSFSIKQDFRCSQHIKKHSKFLRSISPNESNDIDQLMIGGGGTCEFYNWYDEGENETINSLTLASSFKDYELDENEDCRIQIVQHENYLYKISNDSIIKRAWYKLYNQDLYFFSKKTDIKHQGMHHLSGVFIKEEPSKFIGNSIYYPFTIIYSKNIHKVYYTKTKEEYDEWVNKLKEATGQRNINDSYIINEVIGNGKFGTIRKGIQMLNNNEVAIKILSKKEMEMEDVELVKTEIEILKICQHPNIIQLLDVFEDENYYYLIMECCKGGDLLNFIEDRDYSITEDKACEIIHKICAAMFYIHSYGIAHRDLKPENILMTDLKDEADIRIIDFGLSKIIGPNQKCIEPYGTLLYASPEVLMNQPYTKAVDRWTIGILTHLLLTGLLPFHSEDQDEIRRQIIFNPFDINILKNKGISLEAIDFVSNLLQKDPKKRMTIKKALEHEWLRKNCTYAGMRKTFGRAERSVFEIYTSTKKENLTSLNWQYNCHM